MVFADSNRLTHRCRSGVAAVEDGTNAPISHISVNLPVTSRDHRIPHVRFEWAGRSRRSRWSAGSLMIGIVAVQPGCRGLIGRSPGEWAAIMVRSAPGISLSLDRGDHRNLRGVLNAPFRSCDKGLNMLFSMPLIMSVTASPDGRFALRRQSTRVGRYGRNTIES